MHLFRRSRNYPNKFSSVAVIQPSGEMSDNNPGGIISPLPLRRVGPIPA